MTERFFNLLVAGVMFLLCIPLYTAIALVIKSTSKGDVFFKQERIGLRGKPFIIWKFRTMTPDSAKHLDRVMSGDSRVTSFGRLLRSTHLDELPQLWNVIKGDMSLVGPRPHTLDEASYLASKYSDYKKRLTVLPGITGLSQLCGRVRAFKKDDPFLFKIRLDLEYIEKKSLLTNVVILLKTILVVLKRQGV